MRRPHPERLRETEPAAQAAGALATGTEPVGRESPGAGARRRAPITGAGPLVPALLPARFAAPAAASGCRGRGAATRIPALGRRRHHVSGPGWRGRSGPCPAPRARAHTRGGAGPHPHPTPAQPGPGLPGARGCLLLDGAMGPFWESKGKSRRLCGLCGQCPRAREGH